MSTSLLHRSIISRAYHMHRAYNSASSTRALNLLLRIPSTSHNDHQPSSSDQKSIMNVGQRSDTSYCHRMISTTASLQKSANDRMTLHTHHHRTISTTALKYKSAMPLSYDDDTVSPSAPNTRSTPFLLADIGEGISEVEVLQWFVQPGEKISQFDRVCEVQSDKANVEITSRYDGTIETLCGNVGDMMFVGKPLLYIATAADESSASSSGGEAQEKQVTFEDDAQKEKPNVQSIDSDINLSSYNEGMERQTTNEDQPFQEEREFRKKVLTSPAVRKLCKEHNIDLSKMHGTGPKGIVLKSDVLSIISMNSSIGTAAATTSSKSTHEKIISKPTQLEEDTVIPIRGYNRLMVKSMISSLQVPHMIYSEEINVNKLTEVRDSLRPLAMDHGVQKLTYLPFFIKAASLAMLKYPVLNSTIDIDEMTLTYHAEHHIGVAVDTERGLAVPVVKSCQNKSVLEIAHELNRLYSLVSKLSVCILYLVSYTNSHLMFPFNQSIGY